MPNGSGLRVKPVPAAAVSEPATPATSEFPSAVKLARTRPQSPVQPYPNTTMMQLQPSQNPLSPPAEPYVDDDPFDVRETVNMLTLQFLSDHPETRIAALEWLLMLHLKAPTKVISSSIS